MKLKLLKAEFVDLLRLLNTITDTASPHTPQGWLLFYLIEQINIKFRAKVTIIKSTYTITFTNAEAIAFVIFFSAYQFNPDQAFEKATVYKINGAITEFLKHT